MKTKIIRLLLLSGYFISANVHAWGDDKVCTSNDIKNNTCEKGDAYIAVNFYDAALHCDLSKTSMVFAMDESTSRAVCVYRGSERSMRSKN